MKILPILLFLAPVPLFGQGNVGVGTTTPDHPFQVNVDSIFSTVLVDQILTAFPTTFLEIVPASQKGAQSVTVGITGLLSAVEINFTNPTLADEVLIEAWRGSGPEGTLMSSVTLYDVVEGIYLIAFPSPLPPVTQGEMINFVITPVSGTTLKWNKHLLNLYPGGTAYHWNGSWTTLAYDLRLKTFVEIQDTVEFDVLHVQDDRRVGINDYVMPLSDGEAGDVIQTNGNGLLSWINQNEFSDVRRIQDADDDTKVEVEANPDEDVIRFKTNGTERMTILSNGKVGIGTDQPTALLHVNTGAVLFKGPSVDLPVTPADPPASGAGTRMMWYPDKAAFRVGRVFGTEWDKDSIGNYSFAGGFGNKAKGIFAFVGSGEGGNFALGTHSFVGNGRDNIASGNYAFIGSGNDNNATGNRSFIGGGAGHAAYGDNSFIGGGEFNTVSGNYSFIASGLGLFARSYGEAVAGFYNTDYTPVSANTFNEADRLFVIGNGTSNANRNNALTILKNGNIGVGTSVPENRIHIEGSTTSSQHILSVQNNYSGTTHVRAIEAISNPAIGYGIGGHFTGGSKGVQGIASVTGSYFGTITGIEGTASGGSNGIRIGVYGTANNGSTNWAGYFAQGNVRVENDMNISGEVGIGISPSNAKLNIVGSGSSNTPVLQVATSYIGNTQIRAVEGSAVPAAGFGYGGHFTGGAIGVSGNANAGNSTALCVGVDANATGTAGTRIGVRGSASGGTTNWAGYFNQGNVYMANELRIGSGALSGATGYKVAIDGKLIAEEVRVQLSGDWPDYIFKENYRLLPLSQVDEFIKENGHLPGIPSAAQVEAEGHHLGEIQMKLLEKIEELTIHLIQLQKQNEALAQRVTELENPTKTTDQ